jgi:glyoxylase-like metal-dependent hydrolase (beta-lactamase superfamily II)
MSDESAIDPANPADAAAPEGKMARPELDYPCGEPPVAGSVSEVAPGVLWMRMRLPFKLDHINLWAIRDGDRWAVVDTGVQSPEIAEAWRALLGPGGALADGVSRVIVTHMHPDHVGMAGWLTRKFDCPLLMTRLEYLNCRVLVADTGREAPDEGVRFYRRAGWGDDGIEQYRTRFGYFGKMIYALPESFRRLRDGDRLRIGDHDWQVVVGTGHSPEHACLWSRSLKLLVSGDQVLPKISSNVSVFPTEPEADPLHGWIRSLERIRERVSDDVLVLPAHNEPFRGLHARLDYLLHGHRVSLDRLRRKLASPCRVIDVFAALFGRAIDDPRLLSLATGESLAHLNYLVRRGEARLDVDSEGVGWYRLV